MSKLRQSARWCPHCMSCDLQNPNGELLALAHSNRLADGKGKALKGRDDKGAITCMGCHDLIDGRAGKLSRQEAQEMHRQAHIKTVLWWIKTGCLSPSQGLKLLEEAAMEPLHSMSEFEGVRMAVRESYK